MKLAPDPSLAPPPASSSGSWCASGAYGLPPTRTRSPGLSNGVLTKPNMPPPPGPGPPPGSSSTSSSSGASPGGEPGLRLKMRRRPPPPPLSPEGRLLDEAATSSGSPPPNLEASHRRHSCIPTPAGGVAAAACISCGMAALGTPDAVAAERAARFCLRCLSSSAESMESATGRARRHT